MSAPPVEIVRSPRRKRTIQAYFVEGRIRVLVPAGLKPEEERQHVEQMVARLVRKHDSYSIDLMSRAQRLAEKYQLPAPTRIEWSDRQLERWGSCTFSDRSVRISSRLVSMPAWVLDYVIVHELAHLAVPRHSPAFNALVGRYELGERAEGYLIAKSEPLAG